METSLFQLIYFLNLHKIYLKSRIVYFLKLFSLPQSSILCFVNISHMLLLPSGVVCSKWEVSHGFNPYSVYFLCSFIFSLMKDKKIILLRLLIRSNLHATLISTAAMVFFSTKFIVFWVIRSVLTYFFHY